MKDETSGRFIGAVSALIDLSPMLAQLNSGVGAAATTILVKDDGTIVAAPNVNLSMNLKSEEFAAVRDTMGTLQGRQAGYILADLRGGKRSLVGFADLKLRQEIPQPGWVIMVTQDLKAATAPLRAITIFAFAMVLLGLLLLSLATMYFFVHKGRGVHRHRSAARGDAGEAGAYITYGVLGHGGNRFLAAAARYRVTSVVVGRRIGPCRSATRVVRYRTHNGGEESALGLWRGCLRWSRRRDYSGRWRGTCGGR